MVRGIHHISMKCRTEEELEKVKDFYVRVLGMSIYRQWTGGALIDSGRGLIEVFNRPGGEYRLGVIAHVAIETDDVDELTERVRAEGYDVFIEPKDTVIASDPPLPARIAFCVGPLGEEIEFFQEMLPEEVQI